MKYLSVCSGIEAASVAWHPLGWRAAAFSEIEPFPSAVLRHHWPEVPNLGDMTKFQDWPAYAIDLFVGGTPCQSFSVAGLRKGLDDPRGNLMLSYVEIAARYRPRWLVWENVPGVLSCNRGADFAAFLGAVTGRDVRVPEGGWQNSGVLPGIDAAYGLAWRVLDAQYFGLAQRRARVFVVGYLGDWRRAAAVLFERHSLQGNPPPRRQAGQNAAFSVTAGARKCDRGENGNLIPEPAIAFNARQDPDSWEERTGPLDTDGTTQAIAFSCKDSGQDSGEVSPTLRAMGGNVPNGGGQVAVAFQERGRDGGRNLEVGGDVARNIAAGAQVRRLTPRECERLQGFPDDYTLIESRGKPAADGPRYKALGNSMAVPVMRWLGERIDAVDAIP